MPHLSTALLTEEVILSEVQHGFNMATTDFCQGTVQMKEHHVTWLLLTVACIIAVSECKQPIQLSGHVGGEVAFCCPVDQHRKLDFLYLQIEDQFVNGFYKSENMDKFKSWPNSRVDRAQNVVYVFGLNISNAGVYTCHFQYSGTEGEKPELIELTVTANYSKPRVHYNNNVRCTDKEDHCMVTCSSHGGYPRKEIMWKVPGSKEPGNAGMWRTVNSSVNSDKDSMLYNVSSVASFNCSIMKQQNISCSVDGVTTDFSICEPGSSLVTVIAAVCMCAVIGLAIFIFCICRKIKSRSNCSTDSDTTVL